MLFSPPFSTQVVTCVSNRHVANQCIVTLRRLYPELPILARATDLDHQKRLTNTLDVMAMVPVLPEDSLLLNLPFGGAVLKVYIRILHSLMPAAALFLLFMRHLMMALPNVTCYTPHNGAL